MSNAPDRRPLVVFTKYSSYLVVDVEDCRDAEGKPVAMQPVTSLCRCGQARNKPFCDGSHDDAPFEG
jgi:CDGSH-type Zn-finger protein